MNDKEDPQRAKVWGSGKARVRTLGYPLSYIQRVLPGVASPSHFSLFAKRERNRRQVSRDSFITWITHERRIMILEVISVTKFRDCS